MQYAESHIQNHFSLRNTELKNPFSKLILQKWLVCVAEPNLRTHLFAHACWCRLWGPLGPPVFLNTLFSNTLNHMTACIL
jgi:hypothetical protein